jgi:hypothetical protein
MVARMAMRLSGPLCSGFCPNGRARDFPHGRVLFDSMEAVFLVYSSRCIVNRSEVRKMIGEFNLPWAATKFVADYHFKDVIPPMLDEDFDRNL